VPDRLDTQAIVAGRDRLLSIAAETFRAEAGVIGVLLGGSLANGRPDAWSDIDLRVVVEPSRHGDLVNRRLEIPQGWHGFLFNEWLPGTQHCVSHFLPFNKIDVFYWSSSTFAPSPWLTQRTKILHDPAGVVASVVAASADMAFVTDRDEISWSLSKGLAAVHETCRRIARGEILYCNALLQELRQHMVAADTWLAGRNPPVTSFAEFERLGSRAVVDVLSSSLDGSGAEQVAQALARLMEVYRDQIIALHDRFGLERPLAHDLEALSVVDGLMSQRRKPPQE
jgi:predicted nucleotidyltransferase